MKNKYKNRLLAAGMILTVLILIIIDCIFFRQSDYPAAEAIIKPFAKEHSISMKEYPDEIKAMLERNPETEEFVLYYPLKKDLHEKISMEQYLNSGKIPHLLQWDMRWGYEEYAGSIMGLSGCGPVCLSMVSIYLLNDISLDPLYIARFAEENDFATKNNGTKWILFSEGAEKLGLISEELPLDKEVMINALKNGKPIVCIMGAGDFTSSGHYIVISEYSEDGFSVIDPNSTEKSAKKWTYERIENQIRNIWAFSVKDS